MKHIFVVCVIVCVALGFGCAHYYSLAKREAQTVLAMAKAMERDSVITERNFATVEHCVKKRLDTMYPVRAYNDMRRLRGQLQRVRDNADISERVDYESKGCIDVDS